MRYTGPITLDKSTLVKARSLSGGAWSALNEAVFAVGPVAESLRISEIMYHPAEDPNAEFIELTNVGDEAINLNLVRFTKGSSTPSPRLRALPREATACWSKTSLPSRPVTARSCPSWASMQAA